MRSVMSDHVSPNSFWLEGLYTHVLPGLAYLVLAYLSIAWLSSEPSEAAAFWPAAGVSITAILLRGYRVCFGLFIASMLFYASSWLDTDSFATILRSLTLMFLLSSAAVMQAAAAVWLLNYFLGGLPALTGEKEITAFLFIIGPIASMVASLTAVTTFLVFGIISFDEYLINWFTWWIGDSIGAIVMVLILLALFADQQSPLYTRRWVVGLPVAVLFILLITLFLVAKNYELKERKAHFSQEAEQLHLHLQERLKAGVEVLYSLRSFFISSSNIDHYDFNKFTQYTLALYPEIKALEWIPRISQSDRFVYEKSFGAVQPIRELDESRLFQRASEREFYYPITYVEPLKENRPLVGLDVLKLPLVRQAIYRTRETNELSFTAPVTLIGNQRGMVGYLQVNHDRVDTGISNEGVVAAAYLMEDFVHAVLARRENLASYIDVELQDITDGSELIVNSANGSAPGNANLTWIGYYDIGGRHYQFNYSASPEFHTRVFQWSRWAILLLGMILSFWLGAGVLAMTGRNIRIRQLVGERTASLQYEVEERRRAEQELRKVSKAVEFSPNMMLITRPNGEIEYSSPKFTEETGYETEEVLGENIEMLHYEGLDDISYRDLWHELENITVWRGEIANRKKSGSLFWAQVSIAPIYDLDEELTHYVVTLQDITENRLISEQISYQASHDQLTALVNRREFEVRLEALLSSQCQPGAKHAFCFLDLDQFKVVNDTSGHVAGDELLRQVSALLQERVRLNDTLARLGGDEFGILLGNCPLEKARVVAEGIRDAIAQYKFCWEQQVFSIGVSIGVVEINEHSAGLTDVLKKADSACYTAKDSGRNRVHLYSVGDEMLAQREGEMQWISEINSALDEDRFILYGQLIVPLQSSQLKPDIEILLRMKSRDGTIVPPGAFLPAAERYQLSGQIDQWVVDHAFAWLERNLTQFGQYFGSCAINLSGGSLGDPNLKQTIIGHLDSSTLLAYKVKFEITETSAIANLLEAQRFIHALKAYGCQFSLDDFGSGLSSFAYLKNLPVDNLKIDGQFVKNILDDKLDLAMVKSINDIGHVMGKVTIAEFVENDEIRALLREIGVDYGQGYGLGLPTPLDQLLQQVSGEDDR